MAGILCDSEMGCHSQFCTELPVSVEMEMESLLEKTAPEEAQVLRDDWKNFQQLYKQFIQRERPTSVWEKICRPPAETIQAYESLCMKPLPTDVSSLLEKLVVLKLNGGLGTYMGVPGPKGLMNVREKYTFLDFTVQQIEHLNQTYGSDVPLVLMNSPFTDEETRQSLQKYSQCPICIHTFVHSRFPPLHKDTRLPMLSLEDWFLSGHGDVYASLCRSGLIELFLAQGKEILFISNIDNLGATVDLHLLSEMLHRDLQNPETTCDFLMEVTDRTQADRKGGSLIEIDGKLRLLEIAQVPPEHVEDFLSVSEFKIFNTNNLWVSLKALQILTKQDSIHLEVIANRQILPGGQDIIRLETAAGSAIGSFSYPRGVNVPRSRFLPVKTTSDLLLVKSNLYHLCNGSFILCEEREFDTVPLVKLGTHFSKVRDLQIRFENIPNLVELDHLTVSGDVTFGKDVVLKGSVIIIANHGCKITIPSGSVLENKVVSGNLSLLDH
ncbi:UTP--glucose-1-phosphate uridylyltransferase-like [Erpetoichthys calabaricus]|uniref:UTP--glucose-1-phosphate uridylyltransferase n=1 Tax=Erpetoichthys calabaricus TaxID=27687 RepID=A0A8C4RGP9_ERPCA|nr:UTP--glucose-1-phosphate uridylyltransferase-like [Erpetoichthys calabaricus]